MEEKERRVEDLRCEEDYIVKIDLVDEKRIGVMGIWGWGG